MQMLSKRIHILLDEKRYRRLRAEARARKSSVSAVIRDAIDAAFPVASDRKRAAWRAIFSVSRIPVSDPDDVKRDLEAIRYRRG